ncbi:MAG: hypothetical protein ACE5I3_04865 [Phycisphaerae bacterium]
MRRAIPHCLTLVAVFGLTIESRAQVVVYSQPNDNPNGPYSDGVPGQFWSTRMADNFMLSDPTNRRIVQVEWWGSSENMNYSDLRNFEGWWIRFYEDTDNLPGVELYGEWFPRDATHEEFTGNYNMDGGREYNQWVELSTPLTLYIEQPYWISIGADAVDELGDGWHWSLNYFEGDGRSAADYFDGTGYHERIEDLAFVLWGRPAGGCPRPGCDPGDIDADCDVDLSDLAELLSNYGMTSGATYEDGDLDGDGDVDLTDLAMLLAVYGNNCN